MAQGNWSDEYPHLQRQWVNDKENGNIADVSKGSHKIKKWQCDTGCCETTQKGHIFRSGVNKRVSGTNCSVCSGKKICECENACGSAWQKASEEVREDWPTELNGDMKTFLAGSKEKKLWYGRGEKCHCSTSNGHHLYYAPIHSRVKLGSKCAVCVGKQICACENACTSIWYTHQPFRKSWVGNIEDMKLVSKGCNDIVPWDCLYCDGCKTTKEAHRFEAEIYSRLKNENYCPYSSGKKICPCENACNSAWYMLPHLRESWAGNINVMKTVTPHSDEIFDWKCKKCENIYPSSLHNKSKGRGCPICEETPFLKTIHKSLDLLEAKFEVGKMIEDNTKYAYDFYVPEKNLIIEILGKHIFETPLFHKKKVRFALKNGLSVLCISCYVKTKKMQQILDYILDKCAKAGKLRQIFAIYYDSENRWIITNKLIEEPEEAQENNDIFSVCKSYATHAKKLLM